MYILYIINRPRGTRACPARTRAEKWTARGRGCLCNPRGRRGEPPALAAQERPDRNCEPGLKHRRRVVLAEGGELSMYMIVIVYDHNTNR